jgi:precorrin-6Y C5,15-methyltransferase (decarboxylating)
MIYVVGIGASGVSSLTERALGVVLRAGLLVGTRRFLGEFPESEAKRVQIAGPLDDVATKIEEFIVAERAAKRRPTVAVLATGDPLLFGIAGFIIERFGKRGVTVLPNLSIVAEAFALIKEPQNGSIVVSAHGRTIEELFGEFEFSDSVRTARKIAIFTDKKNSPGAIAREAIKRGLFKSVDCVAHVIEEIGTKSERVTTGTVAALARRKKFASLNILIFILKSGSKSGAKTDPNGANSIEIAGISPTRTGLPDVFFITSTGMITKSEVRTVALSKLDVRATDVVWDVGAGCGSVAIEAARLASKGMVYAFERHKTRVRDIKKNSIRFGLRNLKIIEGEAPLELRAKKIARPSRVFIGGGGGPGGAGIAAILSAVIKRIEPDGVIVVNCVTLETASSATAYFEKRGWAREVVSVAVTRTKPVGGVNILSALNPVFIITARQTPESA